MRAIPSRIARLATAVVASAALVACSSDEPLGPQFPEDVEFAASLNVNLAEMTRLESGVYVQVLAAGEGDFLTEGTIGMRYTLWLPDGRQIDSNREAGDPLFEVDLEFPNTVPGFFAGVFGMRLGEQRLIVVPSELGYGARGEPRAGIPPQSVLVFEAEVVEIIEAAPSA